MDHNAMWSRPVVLYDGFWDKDPKIPPFEGEDLVEYLTSFPTPICDPATCKGRDCPTKKMHACWSPAVYAEGSTRGNESVLAVHYVVCDLDHLKPGQLDTIRAGIAEYEHVIHSTHNHTEADQCYRLIFPITRPILPSEWAAVRAVVIKALDLPADPSTVDLSRLYACPDSRIGIPMLTAHRRGEPIDVDEALEAAGVKPKAAAPPTPAPPMSYDLAELRAKLVEARRSKAHGDERRQAQAELLGRVLDGEPAAESGSRDATLLKIAGMLAYWLPAGTPWEVVLEILRPSLSAMETAPEGLDHWIEEVRDMYARQSASRAAVDAKAAESTARTKAALQAVASRAVPSVAAVEAAGQNWEDLLILTKTGLRACEHNAQVVLACSPELRGTLVWNTVTKQVETRGGPLATVPPASLDTAAAAWMQRTYDLFCGANLVGKMLLQVARENPVDPIAEYLNEAAWDGECRAEFFLERYFGVDVSTEDRARYVRAISKRWLISLVARALRPGCKVDTVLILEGPQGAGKSSALEALVGPGWFLDTALELGDKDTMQAISSAWLVELGELASFRRAEVTRIRQFITSKTDKFRPPYGKVTEESPRRCVFVGTTNPEGSGYLMDRTGNRRYWPVFVGNIDLAGIERDRDLILAEAVALFRAGERWHLAGNEVGLAIGEQEERLSESTAEEAIERWWYGEAPAKRPERFGMIDAGEMALKLAPERIDHKMRTEIGHALRRLGFVRSGRNRQYEATKELLDAPQRVSAARASHLALMSSVKAAIKPERTIQ